MWTDRGTYLTAMNFKGSRVLFVLTCNNRLAVQTN
jgi:hypothetical protein